MTFTAHYYKCTALQSEKSASITYLLDAKIWKTTKNKTILEKSKYINPHFSVSKQWTKCIMTWSNHMHYILSFMLKNLFVKYVPNVYCKKHFHCLTMHTKFNLFNLSFLLNFTNHTHSIWSHDTKLITWQSCDLPKMYSPYKRFENIP